MLKTCHGAPGPASTRSFSILPHSTGQPLWRPPSPHPRSHLPQTHAAPSTLKLLCIQSCACGGHSPPYPAPQPFHPASSDHLSGLRPHITSSKQSSHCSSLGGDSPLNTGFTLLTVSSLSSSLCVSPTRQRSVSKAGSQFCFGK